MNRHWNERYLSDNTPWSAHELAIDLIASITAYANPSAEILEIGCGYEQEAIALSHLGYQITAIDISEAAITQAKMNAQQANCSIAFHTIDILQDQPALPVFDLVFDIAVLQSIGEEHSQITFTEKIAALLKPQGIWINISCLYPDVLKIAETTGVQAPPALTRQELQLFCQNNFTLIEQLPSAYQISRQATLARFPALLSAFKKLG